MEKICKIEEIIAFVLVLMISTQSAYTQRLEKDFCIGTSGYESILSRHVNDDKSLSLIIQSYYITETIYYTTLRVVRLDEQRNVIANRELDSILTFDRSAYVIFSESGDFLVLYPQLDTMSFNNVLQTRKYDRNGNYLWKAQDDILPYYFNLSGKQRSDGGYLLYGPDIYDDSTVMVAIGPEGNFLWQASVFPYPLSPSIFNSYEVNICPLMNGNTMATTYSFKVGSVRPEYSVRINYLIDPNGALIASDTVFNNFIYLNNNLDFRNSNYFIQTELPYKYPQSHITYVYRTSDLQLNWVDSSTISFPNTAFNEAPLPIADSTHIFLLPAEGYDTLKCINLSNQLLWSYPTKSENNTLFYDNNSILIDNKYIRDGVLQWENDLSFPDTVLYNNKDWIGYTPTLKKCSYSDDIYSYRTYEEINCIGCTTILIKIKRIDIQTGEIQDEMTFITSLYPDYLELYADGKVVTISTDYTGKCHYGFDDIYITYYDSRYNSINGAAYIDYNNNQLKEAGEPAYTLGYLESRKGSTSISAYMYGQGYTTNIIDTGTWNTTILPTENYFDISPATFNTSHTDYGYADTVIFALRPKQTIKDLKLTLANTFVTRLGQQATYDITYVNNGTHTASGTVKMVLDPRLNFQSATPPRSSQSGDTLIWNFNNLQAGAVRKIQVQVTATTPPQLNGGDTLHSIALISPVAGDTIPNDNIVDLDEVIQTSFDPNDKYTTTGKDLTPVQIENEEYLTYVVRFQNTGNDTAFRVVIEDTLDTKIDWSSLQPAGASHPFSLQINNGHILQFTFYPIKLPPASINEPKSHGYVAYKVKVKRNVVPGNTVRNTAHIYFDYNTPITTNTVSTRIITLTSSKPKPGLSDQLHIYPNPASDQFYIQTNNHHLIQAVRLFDITGKLVLLNAPNNTQATLQTGELSTGVYFLEIETPLGKLSEKIMIQHQP